MPLLVRWLVLFADVAEILEANPSIRLRFHLLVCCINYWILQKCISTVMVCYTITARIVIFYDEALEDFRVCSINLVPDFIVFP